MENAKYSAWHVDEVFPKLKGATLHTWIKSGIIVPAIPAHGQGFPARYSFLNLIEIGIVAQLTGLGVDSHKFLVKLLQSPTGAGRPLSQYIYRVHNFLCFLVLPGPPIFGRELTDEEKDAGPPHFLKKPGDWGAFFAEPLPAAGWNIVDIRALKIGIERRLPAAK